MIILYNFLSRKSWFFFQIGVFFILSAPVLAAFFILLALISTHFIKQKIELKEKWILPFVLSGIFAIISALFSSFRNVELDGWDPSLSWLGLMNWIPFYYFMWRSQYFLQTTLMRKKIANMFLAGSVPLIFSGFGQMWFNWHGPYVFMNGLIIWFQRYIDFQKGQGISAMFNNQNYAACWLIIIWPFCIYGLLSNKRFDFKKIIYFIFTILLAICVYLTQSRSGIIGTFTSTILLSNKLYLTIIISIILIASLGVLITNLPINYEIFKLSYLTNILGPRVFIYSNTLPIILERPLFGWGAGTFPFIFQIRNPNFNREPTHPHNLIFEMANSYGLIFAFIMLLTISMIMIYSYKIIFLKKKLSNSDSGFNKAWWTSFFALFLSQMYDIQYFDIRISISFWILLTGLICII